MALIDLTIQKPAWKRTDVVEAERTTEPSTTEEAPEPTPGPGVGRRLRRAAATAAVVGIGVVGLLTLRKRRARRKSTPQDTSTEE